MGKGRLFVISGASGVGKSTVLSRVMLKRPELRFSVSATTRSPRPGEVDGESYYFISKAEFEDMIARGAFLEYDAHMDNYYGTPEAQLDEKLVHGSVILDIEPNGAFNVRAKREDAVLIFISPVPIHTRLNLEQYRSKGMVKDQRSSIIIAVWTSLTIKNLTHHKVLICLISNRITFELQTFIGNS